MKNNIKFVISEVEKSKPESELDKAIENFKKTCKIYQHLAGEDSRSLIEEKQNEVAKSINVINSKLKDDLNSGLHLGTIHIK